VGGADVAPLEALCKTSASRINSTRTITTNARRRLTISAVLRCLPGLDRPGGRVGRLSRPGIVDRVREAILEPGHPRARMDGGLSSFERIRDSAGVGAARVARTLSKVTRSGQGSSLPGLVAEKVSPGFIARRAAQLPGGVVLVSGTNGKTTTSSMLRTILRSRGDDSIGNDTGANLKQGIASALLEMPQGAKTAVFEVDEATLVKVVPALRPTLLVLTNVFRDQLDRFGEIERVVELLRQGCSRLPEGATVIANVDDPLLWPALDQWDPIGFGIEVQGGGSATESPGAEAEVCPRCGARLIYEARTIAHLGVARCSRCGWRSSEPYIKAKVLSRDGLRSVKIDVAGTQITLGTGGLHNAYNAAAAICAAEAMGVPMAESAAALESFRPRFGRAEELNVDGRTAWLALMKNPGAADALIGEISDDPKVGAVVVAVNDLSADGRDISWIWDVDFERLASAGLPLVPSGRRASDVAVRLKYAEGDPVPEQPAPLDAIEAALAASPPDRAPVILATYTAMLDVRSALSGPTAKLTDQPA
jgi:lipid II isoglutaminyl synthase (glutamine-hydrolysing)